MQQQAHNTAVLLFIRTELEEVRSKKWYSGAGYRNDLQLASLLNRQVLSVANASQLPTFVVSGKDQVGENFGERFTNAIQSIFEVGYHNVIALGNDCLNLSVDHLLKANERLQSCSLVIGPAADGGAYLIGIHKSIFEEVAFKCLPWQQSSLLWELREMAHRQKASVAWLPEEKDADSSYDLKVLIKELGNHSFANILLQLTGCLVQAWPAYINPHLSYSPNDAQPQRGPPISFN